MFPVSYITEDLIRKLRGATLACPPLRPGKDTGEPATSLVPGSDQKGSERLSRPKRSILREQEAKIIAVIYTCKEVKAQLDH